MLHLCALLSLVSYVQLFTNLWTIACRDLLCPWDIPGKNNGVGCHALLQGIFQTQGLNPHLSHLLHWRQVFTTSAICEDLSYAAYIINFEVFIKDLRGNTDVCKLVHILKSISQAIIQEQRKMNHILIDSIYCERKNYYNRWFVSHFIFTILPYM